MLVATIAGSSRASSQGRAHPGSERLPIFDQLRAVGAFLVFSYHYNDSVSSYTCCQGWLDGLEWVIRRVGALGTNLLLLISGYFVAISMSKGRETYSRFVLMRLARIYLPYVFVLLPVAAVKSYLSQSNSADARGDGLLLLSSVFQNLVLIPGLFPERPILTVTWTLSLIVAGYVTLPWIYIAMRKLNLSGRQRLAVWVAATGSGVACASLNFLSPRICYILLGCLLAECQRSLVISSRRRFLVRALTLAACVGAAIWFLPDRRIPGLENNILNHFTIYSGGLLLIAVTVALGIVLERRYNLHQRIPSLRHVCAFGKTGYSFYLLHGPVIWVFSQVAISRLEGAQASAISYWCIMPLCFLACAISARLMYVYVELPWREQLSIWESIAVRRSSLKFSS
ncbi:MAG: acyltransferase [Bryobacteraceae bacterium]|nr:acyltransferase [Bryobacteraceae bacterium]MDW8380118.1 acyltransferase [Bryobacterales bacterium]